MHFDPSKLTRHEPDPNYVPSPEEEEAFRLADLAYTNLMAAYGLVIEHEIDTARILHLQGLRSLAAEDFK